MRLTTRYQCSDCKYVFIAPTASKCPKCKSENLITIEGYTEKAPLQ